jgi:diacylglycerol kinase family enzyme
VALVAFASVVVAIAAVVVLSGESLIGLVLTAVVCLLLSGAALWWAFTTRKVWKRWFNLALVVLVVVTLVINLVAFSLWQGAGMLAIVMATLAYGLAARQALGGAAPAATAQCAATPPARPWLLVNPRSGDGTAGRVGLVDGARVRGISVHELAPGDDPAMLAREAVAAGADAVGVAGGDGSLGLVAAVAVELDVPFVCVPAGTRNHFAHDLGLDRADPLAALGAFAGQGRRIDVAMVGGRMFLNNVSLGMYARLVHVRERHRRRSNAAARLRAVLIALRHRSATGLIVDGEPVSARVLLVSNNAYELDLLSVGERERLDEGRLYLHAGSGIVRSSWTERSGERFVVDAAAGQLAAAVDGEPENLEAPLEFRIEPGALRVLVPPA